MSENIKLGAKPFYDDVNFIGGIQRSGYFNIKEAKLLTDHGHRLKALVSSEQVAETEDEHMFINAVKSDSADNSFAAKVWLKYQHAIHQSKHKVNTFGSVKAAVDENEESDNTADSDDIIDLD